MAWLDFLKSRRDKNPEQTMFLRETGRGTGIHYDLCSYSTWQVQWVSVQKDASGDPLTLRTPEEQSRVCDRKGPFSLAGREYAGLNYFLRQMEGNWGRDIYGRQVLCVAERFPCFDSYDYLNENRYYRWFFIREGDRLSRLYFSDGGKKLYITEDVGNVERKVWDIMVSVGFCQCPQDSGQA